MLRKSGLCCNNDPSKLLALVGHRAAAAAVLVATALPLVGCGAGGMASAVTTSAEGFDRGACLSRQFRTGEACDQDRFAAE